MTGPAALPGSGGPPPPFYFLIALAAMFALDEFAPAVRWLSKPWTLVGIVFLVFGAGLAGFANRQFARRGTTIRPFRPSSALVTDGAFALTRNPMYAGLVSMLAGTAIMLGTATPFLVLPVFVAVLVTRFIGKEERGLERQFGGRYLAYKREVRRWF